MNINKPIFIIGSGRSGTSILYNLISIHPDVCWFSNYTEKFIRDIEWASIAHRIYDIPILNKRLKKNILSLSFKKKSKLPYPMEGQKIYHQICGFKHNTKTTEEDFSDNQDQKFKKIIYNHLKYSGKKRFISKQTANTQRLRLINIMFPDAYFIHIIRDGRAVAHSLYQTKWWTDTDIWWLGYKPSKWEEKGNDPVKLCGFNWQNNVNEILANKHLFNNRYLELRYENLIETPRYMIKKIIDFCELDRFSKVEHIIPPSFKNMNYKWKKYFSSREQKILVEAIGQKLVELDYTL